VPPLCPPRGRPRIVEEWATRQITQFMLLTPLIYRQAIVVHLHLFLMLSVPQSKGRLFECAVAFGCRDCSNLDVRGIAGVRHASTIKE
jgi:hypothetical protein